MVVLILPERFLPINGVFEGAVGVDVAAHGNGLHPGMSAKRIEGTCVVCQLKNRNIAFHTWSSGMKWTSSTRAMFGCFSLRHNNSRNTENMPLL